jgi:hypothetical protein
MLIVAAVLFALAAVGGLTMGYIYFSRKRNPPFTLAVLHGLFAATALIILLWTVLRTHSAGLVAWALGIFVVAALAGFFLFSYHVRGKPLPGPGVIAHAALAVTAFLLLLAGIAGF